MSLLPLCFDGVGRAFGRRWALRGVTLRVGPGRVVGLAGPNGSGKTTLLRIAAGLEVPTAGSCTWGGNARALSDVRRRGELGWVAHGTHLYPGLSGRENLELVAALRRAVGLSSRPVKAVLEAVGLGTAAERPVRTYSRGMAQRLAVARMLVGEPTLVLLDEPFTALDAGGRAMLAEQVRALAGRGAAVLLSSHDPAVCESLCDEVLCLRAGRVTVRLERACEPDFGRRLREILAGDAGTVLAPRASPSAPEVLSG